MWITNPTEDDFAEYVIDKTNEETPLPDGFAGQLAQSLGTGIIDIMTTRDDYKIFSVFTVSNGTEKGRIIGIFKKVFFRI